MKVYGGHWNLPGVKDMPNPFTRYLCDDVKAMANFGVPRMPNPASIATKSVEPVQLAREVTPPQETVAETSLQ